MLPLHDINVRDTVPLIAPRYLKIEEENCKKDVIDKCTHGADRWGNFPQ